MQNNIKQRCEAILRKLAGWKVTEICRQVGLSRQWFYKWWRRYWEKGISGLSDHPSRPKNIHNRISDGLEETITKIRKRLEQGKYNCYGPAAIHRELETLGSNSLPSVATIARVLKRCKLTKPLQNAKTKPEVKEYPAPIADRVCSVQQLDIIGPCFLYRDKHKYYFITLKDIYDSRVYAQFSESKSSTTICNCLIHGWQSLGLPKLLQMDNAAEFRGSLYWKRTISQVVRLCLYLGIEALFIPEGMACRNGSIENFNGLFDRLLLSHRLRGPCHVRRELEKLLFVANNQHPHKALDYRTSAEVRCGLKIYKLPKSFSLPDKLPICAGKISFIRLVRKSGRITILNEKFKIGKRFKSKFVKATIFTKQQKLKVYYKGRIIKEFDYKLRLA
jgi:transposase InsO family protein